MERGDGGEGEICKNLSEPTIPSSAFQDLSFYKKKDQLSADLMWEIDRVHLKNRLPIFANEEAGKDWYGEGMIGEPIP